MNILNLLPSTTGRVVEHSPDEANRRIEEEMEISVAYYAANPHGIDERLDELDREWDIERLLEANASTLAFMGVALGWAVDRRFLLVPAVVTAFLMQHATQGWCPPVPVFRSLGVRTAREIEIERYALKYLRGDFDRRPSLTESAFARAGHALTASRR